MRVYISAELTVIISNSRPNLKDHPTLSTSKNGSTRDSVWSRYRWLAVSTIFFTIFHGKKLNAFFSKPDFFSRRCSFVRNYWTDPHELLTTYSSHVWIWLELELCQNFYFYDPKNHPINLIFDYFFLTAAILLF